MVGTNDFDTKENATVCYDTIRLKWKTGFRGALHACVIEGGLRQHFPCDSNF